MALNILKTAKQNAANEIEEGRHYKKEELQDQWLTIERVGLVDKPAIEMGKPVIDKETGEQKWLLWASFRFKEYPDGYFRGFSSLNRTVKQWVDDAGGDIDAVNAELAATPLKITFFPTNGRSWQYRVELA